MPGKRKYYSEKFWAPAMRLLSRKGGAGQCLISTIALFKLNFSSPVRAMGMQEQARFISHTRQQNLSLVLNVRFALKKYISGYRCMSAYVVL